MQTEAFTIQPLEPSRAALTAEVFERAWNYAFPDYPRRIAEHDFTWETEGEVVHIAMSRDGQVKGFIAVDLAAAFIHHLFVDPCAHGRGIGRALLNTGVVLAGPRAHLKCALVNERALTFYRKLGWCEGDRGEDDMGGWVRLTPPYSSR